MTLWEIFCSTGKVQDYLSYRREVAETEDKEERERSGCYASYNERSGPA